MSLTIGNGITLGAGITITPSYSVVTDGLVVELDAGNPTSYPGSGSTWTDLVAAKEFTLYGSPSYSSSNGGYLNFDPASQQWADATSLPSSLANWTVEAWHYYAGTNNNGSPCIVTEAYAGGPINYTVGNCTDSSPNLQVGYWDGGSFHPTPQGTVLTAGQWYQVVGTFDGTANQLYLNGTFVSSTATTSAAQSGGAGIRLMRRWDADQYWGGRLGIVRIYDAALTESQIAQNYAANSSRFGL